MSKSFFVNGKQWARDSSLNEKQKTICDVNWLLSKTSRTTFCIYLYVCVYAFEHKQVDWPQWQRIYWNYEQHSTTPYILCIYWFHDNNNYAIIYGTIEPYINIYIPYIAYTLPIQSFAMMCDFGKMLKTPIEKEKNTQKSHFHHAHLHLHFRSHIYTRILYTLARYQPIYI